MLGKRLYSWIVISIVFLITTCGGSIKSPFDSQKSEVRNTIPVSVSLKPKVESLSSSGVNLSTPSTSVVTNFSMTIMGCLSGFTTTIDENTAIVNFPTSDTSCLVKLTSFTTDMGITYTPSATHPFTTWQIGDYNIFNGTDSTSVYVAVVDTVSSPIVSGDVVQYEFATYNVTVASPVHILGASVSVAGGTIAFTGTSQGQVLRIFGVGITAISTSNLATLAVELSCNVVVSGTTCSSIPLPTGTSAPYTISYGFLNAAPANLQTTYTYAVINAAASTALTGTAVAANGGTPVMPNGGVSLSTFTKTPGSLVTIFQKIVNSTNITYNYWNILIPTVNCGPSIFAGGAGTLQNPYQVNSAEMLYNTQYCTTVNTYFIQTAHIDLVNTVWTPIQLYGQYNGNGYDISNLSITGGTTTNVGLFSVINVGSSISSLNIRAVNLSGGVNIGALAAQMLGGTLTSIFSSGSVIANSIATGTGVKAGGLIGSMVGGSMTSASSSVDITFNAASGNANVSRIGGLIGYAASSTGTISISSSSATGSISASGTSPTTAIYSGGFIGEFSAVSSGMTISNSYATGGLTSTFTPGAIGFITGGFIGFSQSAAAGAVSVSGSFATGSLSVVSGTGCNMLIGGFIGSANSNTTANTMSNSYAMGSITVAGTASNGAAGGFIGSSGSSTITTSYSSASSMSVAIVPNKQGFIGANPTTASSDYFYANASVPGNSFGGVTGLTTTTAMQTQSSFTGFTFPGTWRMPSANPLSPAGLLSPVLNWQCGSNGITCI